MYEAMKPAQRRAQAQISDRSESTAAPKITSLWRERSFPEGRVGKSQAHLPATVLRVVGVEMASSLSEGRSGPAGLLEDDWIVPSRGFVSGGWSGRERRHNLD